MSSRVIKSLIKLEGKRQENSQKPAKELNFKYNLKLSYDLYKVFRKWSEELNHTVPS